jgi:hypothetical protein
MNAARVSCLALALCGICAAQQDVELSEWMKASNQAITALKKLDSQTGPEAVRAAERLGGIYERMIGFWRQKNATDAAKLSEQGKAAALELANAAFAKELEGAATALKAVSDTCMPCHRVYRERLPDGTYRLKTDDGVRPRRQGD